MKALHVIGTGTGGFSIVELVRGLNYESLKALLPIVQSELDRKNPENIQRQREEEKFWAKYREKRAEKDNALNLAHQSLKRVLIPGTRLKMRGCKDGQGLREFIRWDGQNLVCWQIIVRRRWRYIGMGNVGEYVIGYENTNTVTTHMPDKVSGVYDSVSKQLVPMKKILAGLVPA